MIAETCHPIDLATFCDARATAARLPDSAGPESPRRRLRSVFELERPILRR